MMIPPKALAFFGYGIRVALAVAYVVLVGLGFRVLQNGRADTGRLELIAARAFPVGYRLHSGDIEFKPQVPIGERRLLPPESNPVGKYLSKIHSKGDIIATADLSVAPVINVGAGKLKYFFPLEKQMDLAEILNTDSHVDVCATTCAIERARVSSIVCGGAPSSKCFAVLELSTEQTNLISSKGKDDYRLVLRSD